MTRTIAVPAAVLRKVRALGEPGHRWLQDLDAVIDELEAVWSIRVGATLAGGTGGLVAEVIGPDGAPAVLKIPIPEGLDGQSPFVNEIRALQLGQGRGYVDILRYEPPRRAVLLERLGPSLGSLHRRVEDQIDVITRALLHAWTTPTDGDIVRTGAQQAESLFDSVAADWEQLGQPCSPKVLATARAFAQSRRDAFNADTSVRIYGDAHPANVLRSGGGDDEFKLIDPDGMLSERAHDLAIPLRDWSEELLAADAGKLGRAWCQRLADHTQVDAQPIWEWAFLERVSTGLFMTRLGDERGALLLAVAEQWLDAPP